MCIPARYRVGLFAGALLSTLLSSLSAGTEDLVLRRHSGVAFSSNPAPRILSAETGSTPFWAVAAVSEATGEELYRIDPQSGAAQLIADLNPGPSSSQVKPLAWAGDTLFFSNVDERGRELWMTRGGAENTRIVADLSFGSASSNFEFFSVLGENLVFTVRNSAEGVELYAKSPQVDGATRLTFFPGASDSSRCELFPTGTGAALFFYGNELWRTDGTLTGTAAVKTLTTGNPSSVGARLLLRDGATLWFAVTQVINNQASSQVWASDGTAAGTRLVMDNPARGTAGPLEVAAAYRDGASVYLAVMDRVAGRTELWTSGGTPATTVYHSALLPLGDSVRTRFFEFQGRPWVFAYRGGFDPAQTGTVLRPVGGAPVISGAETFGGEIRPVVTQARVFVRSGGKLWATNGTAGAIVLDENPHISEPVLHRGVILYISGGSAPAALWKVDPVTLEREALLSFAGPAALPELVGGVGKYLCWSVNDAELGAEIFATDGTRAGSFLVRDFVPGAGSGLSLIGEAGGSLVFRASADAAGTLTTLSGARAVLAREAFTSGPGAWSGVSGNWILEEGGLVQVGNTANALAVASGPAVSPPGDFRFSATLTAEDDDAMGLVFGYQNPANYFRLVLVEQAVSAPFVRGVALERVVNGAPQRLAFAPPGYVVGRAIQVELEASQQSVAVRVDGVSPFPSVTVAAPLGGAIGAYGNWQDGVRVDDVLVETAARPAAYFHFEVEDPTNAAALGAYVVQGAPLASGAKSLSWPNNGANRINEAATSTLPPLRYSFRLAEAGALDFWIRGACTTGFDDSFFYRIDGGPWVRRNLPLSGGVLGWLRVNALGTLAAGEHVIELLPREDGGVFDAMFVAPASLTPTSL
jgi:ELWxxDGT repeat protein